MTLKYMKPKPIRLKNHPEFNEKWLQARIAEDPSILGLGDLELKDIEKKQPKAGRLDLLLRDPETGKRYEVELMLGVVDESHIIRTIEYWDIERKRYPQYDHCAVIVAEDITSRFLNIMGLFNSAIPLVAIQLNALEVGDHVVLNFVKVLDELTLGEEDEDGDVQPADRNFWLTKGSKHSLAIVDGCVEIIRSISEKLDPKYNKHYIGLAENGMPNNFVIFRPQKKMARVQVRIADKEDWLAKLEAADLEAGHANRAAPGRIDIRPTLDDLQQNADLLRELFENSWRESNKNE